MTHPAADLLRAIADGKQMEHVDARGGWHKATPEAALYTLALNDHISVRIARQMVTRTVTYPEPLRVKPEIGSVFYYHAADYECPLQYRWDDSKIVNNILNAGMAFATEADAAEAHRALFGGGQ